jgi:hypothetical protein
MTAAVTHEERSAMARRLLILEAILGATVVLAVLLREVPGMIREVRIWRMVGFRTGSRHPR